MRFEWSNSKAILNLKKHGISFEEASSVFFDDLAKISFDPYHSDDEHRQILIGHSFSKKLLFVVHISYEEKDCIRIISARRATKNERRDFETLKKR